MSMTNEEAAKIIGCMGWGYQEKQIEEASKMAVKALREKSEAEAYRTPKKVKAISPDPKWKFYYCPNCGAELSIYCQSYCVKCGQALKWEEQS